MGRLDVFFLIFFASFHLLFFNTDIANSTTYSSITNSQGIATYSYTSSALGDIEITASIGSLSDTVLIEDCISYYLTEQSLTGNSSNDLLRDFNPTWRTTEPFEVTMDIKSNNNGFFAGIHEYGHLSIQDFYVSMGKAWDGIPRAYWTGDKKYNMSITISNNTYYNIKYVVNEDTVDYYFNNNYITSYTSSDVQNVDLWSVFTDVWVYNTVLTVKNVKVKPIS